MAEDGIRIVVINGSVRPGNYTAMASALVVDELKKHTEPKVQVDVVDPAEWHLPLPGTDPQSTATGALQKLVREATGVVLVTSEYHGGFSSAMKLVIENLGFPSVLSAKPVALLGVAAGTIGAIKSLEQLRSVCAHIGAIVLPLPISVPNVQKVFDKESMLPGTETIHWGEQWQARGKSSTVGTTRQPRLHLGNVRQRRRSDSTGCAARDHSSWVHG